MFKKNAKLQVSGNHKFHPGRIGYFQFMGGPKRDCVVLAAEPKPINGGLTLFAVGPSDAKPV